MSSTNKSRTTKALFLDRDGVINVNHGYVYRPEDCDFVPGIFELCAAAQAKNYTLIIVTNQSGIARNYYNQKQFMHFSKWIEHQFSSIGIRIAHTFHCPHHPKISGPCICRKPKPGMVVKAARHFRVRLGDSIMVGDSWSDIECAQRAKVGKAVLFKDPQHTAAQAKSYQPDLHLERSGRYFKARSLSSISRLL